MVASLVGRARGSHSHSPPPSDRRQIAVPTVLAQDASDGGANAAAGDRQGVGHADAEFAIRCFMARDTDWLREHI